MTRNLEEAAVGGTVADVHDWLTDRGYTAAPLAREDPPYIYRRSRPSASGLDPEAVHVTRKHLATVREEAPQKPAHKHADRIDLSTLLSPDLGFEALLVELEAEPFYFVGWHGEVAGILTRSDLNKPAAHALRVPGYRPSLSVEWFGVSGRATVESACLKAGSCLVYVVETTAG
jgi:hypothetical protein